MERGRSAEVPSQVEAKGELFGLLGRVSTSGVTYMEAEQREKDNKCPTFKALKVE